MVKVNAISRSKLEWTKDRDGELPRAHRNYDPGQNPFMKQTEYTRAVRAAKLEQMFAKPFVAAMGGHHDTVQSIATDPTNLSVLASGGHDGEIVMWDAFSHKQKHTWMAHRNAIDGCCFTPDGVALLTCGRDRLVKVWDTDFSDADGNIISERDVGAGGIEAIAEYKCEAQLFDIDHSWNKNWFVTAGDNLEVWDINRTRPIQTFNWGDDSIMKCAFNKIERDLVACAFTDRGVGVYDTRTQSGHSKLIMDVGITSCRWSPMDPNLFIGGSDDWNVYLYDMRVPGRPRNVFQGPVHAVTSVDFSPTGQYICAGSTDCTVSLWDINAAQKSKALEVYHTKRMAKVQAVRFSLDNNYIFSGSEDAIVRVWKCDRSKPVRLLRGSEKHTFNYMRELKDRYKGFEEVKRISNQRNTPKAIRKRAWKKKRIMQRKLVSEMAAKGDNSLKPLARKKTKQYIK